MPQVYSCRAECRADIDAFLKVATEAQLGTTFRASPNAEGFPDTDLEMVADASLAELRWLMHQVPDTPVMRQTLRACFRKDNTMERDYSIH